MKSLLADLKRAYVAEVRKMVQLRTHIIILVITVSLLIAVLGLDVTVSREGQKTSAVNLDTIWKIFHFFSQYITPLIFAVTAAHQIGKEFEWKTFHQIQLKGQTPLTYILSKLTAFYTLATGVYVIQAVAVVIFYCVRAWLEGQGIDLPFHQIFGDILFYLTAIPVAVAIAIFTVSASGGIILSLVYLGLLEMMIFPLVGSLMGVLNQHAIATALSYTPMKLPVQVLVNSETFLEASLLLLVNLGFIAFVLFLAHYTLVRRQIGLIR